MTASHNQLSPAWQQWLRENHQRQIPDQQLVEIMVNQGIDQAIAKNATVALKLPAGWLEWIQENQSLHVPDVQLIETMVREGIAVEIATAAVEYLHQTPNTQSKEAQLLAKLESILAVNRQLAQLSPNFGKIARRDRISKQEFLESYYATNTPVILTGMMQDWAAMSRWTPEYLRTNYGNVAVEIQTGRNTDPDYEINTHHHRKIISLSEYVDMVVTGGETNDYYMVANNANLEREELNSLLKDIVFPEFLDSNHLRQQVFFWFGPAGTITPLHHDPLNLIMAHVSGRKRWRLISPNYTPLLYNYVGVFSQVDLEQPDYEKYPLFKQVDVIETVLEPGEIIFIPVGWWHQVKALDISLSVSFTNFVFPNSYSYQHPHIYEEKPVIKTQLDAFNPKPLTYEAVINNLNDGYLVDEIFPNEMLIISFGFVAWDGVPGFDFYGRTKKLEQLANRRINRILVRDFANAWYHRGVRGLGDNIQQVCDRLQQFITKIAPSRVVTVGQSMGAYAAILFGHLLEVDQVLAFGTLSCLDSQTALAMGDTRWLAVMQDLEANPPAQYYFDLVDLADISRRSPQIDIFYGQKPDPDTPGSINLDDTHAKRLTLRLRSVSKLSEAEALTKLPLCRLHPYPESGHAIVQYLIEQKLIDSVLFNALFC